MFSSSQKLPDMGSGQIGDPTASHFRKIKFDYYRSRPPPYLNGSQNSRAPGIVISSNCYKAGGESYKDDYWGYSFWYGGKGGDKQYCQKY